MYVLLGPKHLNIHIVWLGVICQDNSAGSNNLYGWQNPSHRQDNVEMHIESYIAGSYPLHLCSTTIVYVKQIRHKLAI